MGVNGDDSSTGILPGKWEIWNDFLILTPISVIVTFGEANQQLWVNLCLISSFYLSLLETIMNWPVIGNVYYNTIFKTFTFF